MNLNKLATSVHSEYRAEYRNWEKYRKIDQGGKAFLDAYLETFSTRESAADFDTRKKLSYCVGAAKSAVLEMQAAIYQRLVDVVRQNGPASYVDACTGKDPRGVDRAGSSMSVFIGKDVLHELVFMRKVGVFVNLADSPYLQLFKAEDILNWAYDSEDPTFMTTLLLQTHVDVLDEFGLQKSTTTQYEYFQVVDEGVHHISFVLKGRSSSTLVDEIIPINRIPFVEFKLSSSLLSDIADQQIALTNLASSDLNICKSNFPFYIEQFDFKTSVQEMMKNEESGDGKNTDDSVGVSHGRRYHKGLEAPRFIHPSSEPLMASLAKQAAIKQEIRETLRLTVSNMEPRRESADSKKEDNKSLEAGLSYIGLELAYGEKSIANLWADYEGYLEEIKVSYPEDYSLKTDADRQAEAKSICDSIQSVPSTLARRIMLRKAIRLLIGREATSTELMKIMEEVEAAKLFDLSIDAIIKAKKEGLITNGTASKLLGYSEAEAVQAESDYVNRLARIAEAQMLLKGNSQEAPTNVDN